MDTVLVDARHPQPLLGNAYDMIVIDVNGVSEERLADVERECTGRLRIDGCLVLKWAD